MNSTYSAMFARLLNGVAAPRSKKKLCDHDPGASLGELKDPDATLRGMDKNEEEEKRRRMMKAMRGWNAVRRL